MRRLRTSPRTLCYCSGPLNSEDLKRLSTVDHLSLPLQALWHDAAGNWTRAHELCQAAGSREGDWVHAYLHRKEGDISNARYWYSRSGRPSPLPDTSLSEEWAAIAETLLEAGKVE